MAVAFPCRSSFATVIRLGAVVPVLKLHLYNILHKTEETATVCVKKCGWGEGADRRYLG